MKILLVGPYPPPHGGVSVHVLRARQQLERAGVPCRVLNVDRRAPRSDAYVSVQGPWDLTTRLFLFARDGWTIHLHTNGHNAKSWGMALICGLAAQLGPRSLLTLHSGMAPAYLNGGSARRRILARAACSLYRRIICVNPEIQRAIRTLDVPEQRLDVVPAFLPSVPGTAALPEAVETWIRQHDPVLSATLFFRREYGFEALVEAVRILRERHHRVGCLVMGSGEEREEAAQSVRRAGLEQSVLLLGDVDHGMCLALMARSDVFVRPTLHDGDSISVREALSLGVPVVASNVGLRPNGTLLFEPGRASEMVLQIEIALGRRSEHGEPQTRAAFDELMKIYGRVTAECES